MVMLRRCRPDIATQRRRGQGNEVWLVKLAGVDGPEDADALRGHSLLVRADQRPPLDGDDEFYVQVRR